MKYIRNDPLRPWVPTAPVWTGLEYVNPVRFGAAYCLECRGYLVSLPKDMATQVCTCGALEIVMVSLTRVDAECNDPDGFLDLTRRDNVPETAETKVDWLVDAMPAVLRRRCQWSDYERRLKRPDPRISAIFREHWRETRQRAFRALYSRLADLFSDQVQSL